MIRSSRIKVAFDQWSRIYSAVGSRHAVFEAAKSVAQRVREMTGLTLDGAALFDMAFAESNPRIGINPVRTETDCSEHKGFALLLKGAFAAIRNPTAHEPKILWQGEDDAADYFTLVSLLHRKLDKAGCPGNWSSFVMEEHWKSRPTEPSHGVNSTPCHS